jgi:hypothetical protein
MTTFKPVTRRVASRLPHGFADKLIVTLHPGGIVEVREPRRKPVSFDMGLLYAKATIEAAWANGARRKRGRKGTSGRRA